MYRGFPAGAVVKCRRHKRPEFDYCVREIPWSRKWHSSPVFLLGKSHEQRSLEGYSLWGGKESDATEHAHTHALNTYYSPALYSTLGVQRYIGHLPQRSRKSSTGDRQTKLLTQHLKP